MDKRAEPLPHVFPHPDDIVLDSSTGRYILFGPFDADGLPFYKWWQTFETLLLLLSEAQRRHNRKDHQESLYLGAYARMVDQNMPPSLRRTEEQWLTAFWDAGSLTQRGLRLEQKDALTTLITTMSVLRSRPSIPFENLSVPQSVLELFAEALSGVSTMLKRRSDGKRI